MKRSLAVFTRKNCKRLKNQKEFRIEKVIKRKGDELYVKWMGYDNHFNSWIDKKDLIKCVNTFHHREVLEVPLKWN